MAYGDGCLYKRGDIYWAKIYRDGRPVCISLKTKSEYIAGQKLRKEVRKNDDDFVEPRHKRVTVGDLVDAAFTHWQAHNQLDYHDRSKARWETHLKSELGDVKAHIFGTEHLNAYRARRVQEGAKTATVNRELQVVRQAFILGANAEPATVKRVPKFNLVSEEGNARRQFATPEQVEALKVAAAKEGLAMRALVEIAIVYGWRRGDLLYLRAKDVRLAENTIRLEDSKNGQAREVPMTKTIRTLAEALVVGQKADAKLWPHSLSAFKTVWNRVRVSAGCPNLLLHDLRRTSARTKRAAGVNTSVIMEMQGWKTEAIFRRYGIVAIEDKSDALLKQEAYERDQLASIATKQLQPAEN